MISFRDRTFLFIMKSDFYFKFENRFRGDEESILKGLSIYDSLIHQVISQGSDPKILDVGCGRGEFLYKWKKYTQSVFGIENDAKMAAICRSKGLEIIEDNAINSLQNLSDNSISIITMFHVVEHLEYDQLFQLLFECSRVLHDDGVLIIETPSIDNLIVSTKNFYIDHSHKTHINPDSFPFIIKTLGFDKVKQYFLRGGPLEETEHNKLTRVFNGVAQDLLLVATKSESMSYNLFDKNKEWESDLNIGITTMQAAIEFDSANLKEYKLKETEFDKKLLPLQNIIKQQGKLLDDINQELKYFFLILRVFNRGLKMFLKIVKLMIRISINVLTKIFNLLLKFPFIKKILFSKSIQKCILIILELFPKKIKLKIVSNINKKIDKVVKIDFNSICSNDKLLSHFESSDTAKDIYYKLSKNTKN